MNCPKPTIPEAALKYNEVAWPVFARDSTPRTGVATRAGEALETSELLSSIFSRL